MRGTLALFVTLFGVACGPDEEGEDAFAWEGEYHVLVQGLRTTCLHDVGLPDHLVLQGNEPYWNYTECSLRFLTTVSLKGEDGYIGDTTLLDCQGRSLALDDVTVRFVPGRIVGSAMVTVKGCTAEYLVNGAGPQLPQ